MSREESEPKSIALDESGHGDLLVDAHRVSAKMLRELDIHMGGVRPRWIEARTLLVLSKETRLDLADLFSEIRGKDHLEGLADLEITKVLDQLIEDGKVTVSDENGTNYFVASALSDDKRKNLMFVLESNISLSECVDEEE